MWLTSTPCDAKQARYVPLQVQQRPLLTSTPYYTTLSITRLQETDVLSVLLLSSSTLTMRLGPRQLNLKSLSK